MNKKLIHTLASIPGALYVASPIDVIPDFIPVAGQADDAVMILLLITINLLIMLLVKDGDK